MIREPGVKQGLVSDGVQCGDDNVGGSDLATMLQKRFSFVIYAPAE
jgi:hypothetical protein